MKIIAGMFRSTGELVRLFFNRRFFNGGGLLEQSERGQNGAPSFAGVVGFSVLALAGPASFPSAPLLLSAFRSYLAPCAQRFEFLSGRVVDECVAAQAKHAGLAAAFFDVALRAFAGKTGPAHYIWAARG
jgi:hypothetical protein